MKGWHTVSLGQVIRQRKEFIEIDDLQTYKRARVQLHAKGIVLRDVVEGSMVKTKRQQVSRAGEFLVAEIDAKVGGFGIVPDDLDGAIVSSHYFLFEIDESKLERRFLDFFIRTPSFRDQVEAQGSTNYAAIRPAHVLAYQIPLPPLAEQRRIVARIEDVAIRTRDVEAVRNDQNLEVGSLLQGAFRKITDGVERRAMRDVAPLIRRPVDVSAVVEYPELGVRSFGKGTFHKPSVSGLELGSKRVFMIEPGDLIFSNVFAWEGAIAVAKPEDQGRVGSHRFITRVPIHRLTTAEFLCFYFLTPEGMEVINAASPGGAGRNRTLGLEALDGIMVPVPPISEQVWFDKLCAEVRRMRELQAVSKLELDALLPAILDRAFKGDL